MLSSVVSEVRRQLRQGVPFERVEAFIETQRQLDEEERAVAWLVGWFGGDSLSLTRELGRESVSSPLRVGAQREAAGDDRS